MANNKFYDCRYDGYTGTKRYYVQHPAHIDTPTVAAPDEQNALVSAADYWGERWQDISFYAYAKVSPA